MSLNFTILCEFCRFGRFFGHFDWNLLIFADFVQKWPFWPISYLTWQSWLRAPCLEFRSCFISNKNASFETFCDFGWFEADLGRFGQFVRFCALDRSLPLRAKCSFSAIFFGFKWSKRQLVKILASEREWPISRVVKNADFDILARFCSKLVLEQ